MAAGFAFFFDVRRFRFDETVSGRVLFAATSGSLPPPSGTRDPAGDTGGAPHELMSLARRVLTLRAPASLATPAPTLTLDALLLSPKCRQRLLAFGTQLGYEVPLRFVHLVQEFRREMHDQPRRQLLAAQLWDHFLSPLSASPICVSLEARRRVQARLECIPVPADVFADAVRDIMAQLNDELFPQCFSAPDLVADFSEALAEEKLNYGFLQAVSNG